MKKIEEQYGHFTINDDGCFHSFDDEPAIMVYDHLERDMNGNSFEVRGYRAWYKEGKLHREGNPAILRNDGNEFFYLDGNLQDGNTSI